MPATAVPREASPAHAHPSRRIGAIDGLRGLALILVVAFHLFGHGRVSGGVDVFLLLSGYFATGALLRRAEDGTLRLSAHYARTLARLLPAALVVLAAVTVALLTLAPRLRWSSVLREVGASATSWENWELVHAALAYGAAGPDASPLQHFWSLSVQGQFFAVWPPVVLGLVVAARRLGRAGAAQRLGWAGQLTPGRLVAAVTGTATAASFGHALWLVSADQQVAYFSTFTRFWEIGAGALLALALRRAVPFRGQTVLGWLGLALVVGSGFLIDGARMFPGAWALVPVGGAALVLLATVPGGPEPGRGVARLLDSAPLRFGARVSYALYLWHWPVLIFWLLATGTHRAGPVTGAGVLAASTVLAWLTTRYVSEPLLTRVTRRLAARRAALTTRPPGPLRSGPLVARVPSGRRTVAVLVGAAVLVLGGAQVAATAHDATVRSSVADLLEPSPDHPGAAALAPGALPAEPPRVPFRPAAWVAYDDHPDRPDCAQSRDVPEVLECTIVAPAEPTAVVYLAGASHEQQYEEAFAALARQHRWELREMLKHGCRLATSAEDPATYEPTCATWNEEALDALVAARPDVVVVVGTRTYEDGSPEEVLPGQVDAWRVLDDAGIQVVTVRDNPRFEWFVPECLDTAAVPEACGRTRAEQLAEVSPVTTAPGVPRDAVHLDLSDSICGPETCAAVVGNVLVYRDDDHLTNTYVRTLTPVLGRQLRTGTPWLFGDGKATRDR